jgi:hypothetical protein
MKLTEIEQFINDTTEPRNTGASADACRIVRRIFQNAGLILVAADDAKNHSGFIAHLCRTVTREMMHMEREKEQAETAQ